MLEAGSHQIVKNLTSTGNVIPAGVYVLTIDTGSEILYRKLVKL
jgi:hypothetical protein